jgi:hypothetical protein
MASEIGRQKAENSLIAKGFQKPKKGDHLRFFLFVNGRKTKVHTKISHGSRKLQKHNLRDIKDQLHFDSQDQTLGFLDCSMGEEQYLQHLVQSEVLNLSDYAAPQ